MQLLLSRCSRQTSEGTTALRWPRAGQWVLFCCSLTPTLHATTSTWQITEWRSKHGAASLGGWKALPCGQGCCTEAALADIQNRSSIVTTHLLPGHLQISPKQGAL